MKKRLIIIITAIITVLSCSAQNGLEINSLFDGTFRDNPAVDETVINRSNRLKQYNLNIYRGITVTDCPEITDKIEKLVIIDGEKALEREVLYKNGKLNYGFYILKPVNKHNRYIFYLNQHPTGGNKTLLIYLEGKAPKDKIAEMFRYNPSKKK